ncbi:ATPase family associated with various cellular activities (AAA) domain-containing protein [Hirsutella rhossiliensis]|uniref:ATPase family associated with various cellular activities (AAA) domain-containing protein n=1 Tax=Hirsutella rhossiliensis TaxID=111463 RepID=A0A9P8N0R1_9HYPO|nr:ATPase family associated with various cellular activities (AAA) domain-containing protein [Hirsutella rhossiliensis]KAH0964725.1 ATPase family associated with various cellular activities (AAA) domain-containing protein [Hirsutella rhossiliensis]
MLPSFRNVWEIRDALAVAHDRQADRLQRERVLWAKSGKHDDPPDDRFLTKEDLLGLPPPDIRQSSSAYAELQAMQGFDKVKRAVEELIDLGRINYCLEMGGKEPIQFSPNRVFLGPPGSGKTTVAKLFGQIVVDTGLVSKTRVVVKDPNDFISNWIGGVQKNTCNILDSTRGMVLIIDDAHGLCPSSDLGRSVSSSDRALFTILDTLVAKTSTDPGQDRCIIMSGYAEQMHDMFHRGNPGLRSRFPPEDAFELGDYEVPELMGILDAKLAKDGIDATEQAKQVASQVLTRARDRPGFGNGRDVHNLVNRARASLKQRNGQTGQPPGDAERAAALAVSLDADLHRRLVLEPQDFDSHWDRSSAAGRKSRDLFKEFVGFDAVIEQFQGYQEMAAGMRMHGKDPRPNIPFTFIFKGPPGTGKTTTARKLGQIFYDMGFLASDEVIECSASDLIGQHLGHTAPLVQSFLEKALGKVLFIDEAYRLGLGARGVRSGTSFEEEAVGELVDGLTKLRYAQRLLVILAGYGEEMDMLIKSNRGLRGRFARDIVFPQLTPVQCMKFLGQLIGKEGIIIRDKPPPSTDKKDKVHRLIKKLGATRDWSNGRDIETLAKSVVGEDMLRCRLAGEMTTSPAIRERCPFRGPPLHPDDKVDSSQAAVASSGALQNLTSYLNGTLANLSSVLHESTEYISGTLGVPPGFVYSSLAALVAVPITMSRYGWSLRRDQSSPYSSLSGGVPAVTDDDFSYITSQDLDDAPIGSSNHRHHHPRSQSAAPPAPEDDVLLVKNKGVTYPSRFPAYSIGDGKLRVRDVRERAGLMMELSDRAMRRLKLLYKGRELKEAAAPVRDYGVKNKSELMAVLPDVGDESSQSEEEVVIVDAKSRHRKKRKPKKRSDWNDGDSATSPREGNSHSRSPPPPASGSGPLKQIDDLAIEFKTKWLPLCVQYTAAPPTDPKIREEEHRKLSEMLMQSILLKLDGVETEGIPEVRARRKELVRSVQDVLKGLDGAAKSA